MYLSRILHVLLPPRMKKNLFETSNILIEIKSSKLMKLFAAEKRGILGDDEEKKAR